VCSGRCANLVSRNCKSVDCNSGHQNVFGADLNVVSYRNARRRGDGHARVEGNDSTRFVNRRHRGRVASVVKLCDRRASDSGSVRRECRDGWCHGSIANHVTGSNKKMPPPVCRATAASLGVMSVLAGLAGEHSHRYPVVRPVVVHIVKRAVVHVGIRPYAENSFFSAVGSGWPSSGGGCIAGAAIVVLVAEKLEDAAATCRYLTGEISVGGGVGVVAHHDIDLFRRRID
jgi:hypothetical protein